MLHYIHSISNSSAKPLVSGPAALAIGNFDGVHIGHQQIARETANISNKFNILPIAVSFAPHPAGVLGGKPPKELASLERRERQLKAHGIAELVVIRFDRNLAKLTAPQFTEDILLAQLGMKHLCVGKGFCLGRGREGDEVLMRKLGEANGFSVTYLEHAELEGERVSSSRIRASLEAGDVESAAQMLGRLYMLTGEVVRGMGRGHDLGYPTANLKVQSNVQVPGAGVYAVIVNRSGREFYGVSNIGRRPTFDHQEFAIEAHLFECQDDLYGDELSVQFFAKIRDERKFDDAGQLSAAIEQDITVAKQVLGAAHKQN